MNQIETYYIQNYNLKMINESEKESNTDIENISQKSSDSLGSKNKVSEYLFSGKSQTFQMESNNCLKVSLFFSFIGLVIVHTFVVQQQISSQYYASILLDIIQYLQTEVLLYQLFFFSLILIKFLLILTVVIKIVDKVEVMVLQWLTKKVMASLLVIVEFDLALSAFMTIINWQQNIALLLISTLISFFYAIYRQNYVVRKDYLYISQANHYFLFRTFIILTYYANTFFFVLNDDSKFYSFSCVIGTLHLFWYFKKGHTLFIHRFSRNIFMALNALFITFHIVFAQKLIIGHPIISNQQILKLILIFAAVTFLLYCLSLVNRFHKQSFDSPKEIDILFKRLLESAFSDKDTDSKLIGILQMHQISDSDYYNTLKQKLYDPLLKVESDQSEIYLQKQTAVMFYVKKIYEQEMNVNDDPSLGISYCEFVCNEYNHFYLAFKELQRIKLRHLNIIQRIKIAQLENYIIKQQKIVNKDLYNGALEIESIIESDDCFHLIQGKVRHYIAQNLHVWKSLGEQEIKLGQFRTTLKKEFKMLTQIDALWKKIAKFFTCNKVWLFIYVHYVLFIKNERIKQKETDFFNDAKSTQSSIFSHQMIYFNQKQKSQRLLNPAIMFNQDTCCLIAMCIAEKLIIRRVNRTFTRVTDYQEQEIVGSMVEVLMPSALMPIHSEKFNLWLEKGYISNEKSFKIHSTAIVTKDLLVIPAFKYYKAHCHIENGVQFVCLLKSNLKPEVFETNTQIKANYTKRRSSFQNQHINHQKLGEELADSQQKGSLIEFNIFMKEESFQPKKTFKQFKYFKLYSRIFIFIMLASIFILSNVTKADTALLSSHSNQLMTVMNMHRYPIVLGINYIKNFLHIGNSTQVNAQIQQTANNMVLISTSMTTKLAVFDQGLNPKKIYHPYYNYSFLLDDSLSGVDMLYTMVSAISSLNQSIINRTSREYQRFNSYIKPSYDTMMNTTKYKLHQTFGSIFGQTIIKQACFMSAQAAIFIAFAVLLLNLIRVSFVKLKNILVILLDFNTHQIENVHQYWKDVAKSFNILFMHLHSEGTDKFKKFSLNKLNLLGIDSQNLQTQVFLNKRSKRIAQDNQHKNYELKLKLKTFFIMLAIISLIISTEFYTLTQFQHMQQFQLDSFFFLKQFSYGPLVVMGCIQRYYSQLYPQQVPYNAERYDDALLANLRFGSGNDYIGTVIDSSSQYYAKQKNYFFGNPCEYNPFVLIQNNISICRCLNISNGAMKQGLASYLRYVHRQGSMCINNKISMAQDQLDQMTIGITILSNYVFDAISTWTNQFNSKIKSIEAENVNLCLIVLGVVFVVHLLKQYMIAGSLTQQYEFVKQMYLYLVPEFILVKEKVIRQKFIIEGIIS